MGYREGITKEGVTIEGVTNRELPFSTPAFAEAWKQWQQHRREIRKKLTPLAESKQLRSLANMGEARAIAAIEHSIENGWQGIFEPKSTAGKPTKQPATVDIGRRGYKQNSNP